MARRAIWRNARAWVELIRSCASGGQKRATAITRTYKGIWVSDEKRPSLLDVVKSVLASFLGVQSGRNRERDFQHGRPIHFIIVGFGVTILFVLVVWGIVRIVLRNAGV